MKHFPITLVIMVAFLLCGGSPYDTDPGPGPYWYESSMGVVVMAVILYILVKSAIRPPGPRGRACE